MSRALAARDGVVNAVAGMPRAEAATFLRRIAYDMAGGRQMRPGPNDRMPCGTDSARRRHLAHAEACGTCGTEGRRNRIALPDGRRALT